LKLTAALLIKWNFNNLIVIEFDRVIFKQINICNRIFMDKVVLFALSLLVNEEEFLESHQICLMKLHNPVGKTLSSFQG
jgi:hypothetical protein